MMYSVLQLDPDSITLEASDPFLDTSVPPVGVILSVIDLFVVTGLTVSWFQRRELK